MAFGLKLVQANSMSQNTGGVEGTRMVNPANTTAIFRGDPVVFDANGFVERAATTGPFQGVFAGCRYVDTRGGYQWSAYWPGSAGNSDVQATIIGSEMGVFAIEADSSLGDVDQAFEGTRRNVIINAGSTVYGDSRVTLGAVNATGPCYVVGRAKEPGNEYGQPSVVLLVTVAVPQRTA